MIDQKAPKVLFNSTLYKIIIPGIILHCQVLCRQTAWFKIATDIQKQLDQMYINLMANGTCTMNDKLSTKK